MICWGSQFCDGAKIRICHWRHSQSPLTLCCCYREASDNMAMTVNQSIRQSDCHQATVARKPKALARYRYRLEMRPIPVIDNIKTAVHTTGRPNEKDNMAHHFTSQMSCFVFCLQSTTPCSEKKWYAWFLVITYANVDRFSKFLHWRFSRKLPM